MGLFKTTTMVSERRGWARGAMKFIVVSIVLGVLYGLPKVLPPIAGVLLVTVGAFVAILVLSWYNKKEAAGPTAWKVQAVGAVMAAGIGYAVYVAAQAGSQDMDRASRMLLPGLLVVSTVVPALTAWVQLRNTNPAAWPVTVGDAVDAFADGGRVRAVALGATLMTGIGFLASTGFAYAPLAVIGTFLIPVVVGLKSGRARGLTRVEYSAAFCGCIPASGGAWTKALEEANRSPITCAWDDDREAPTRITMSLPPGWKATGVDALEIEVAARLAGHGIYVIDVDLGSKRRVTAKLVPVMPEFLHYDGHAADRGTIVSFGVGRATREHASIPTLATTNGDLLDVTWDTRVEPHGLIVGKTGQGKTQALALAMLQLAIAGYRLILLDPKRVEFSQWVGRRNVIRVADTLETMVEALTTAHAEMDSRFDMMKAAGVNHIDLLPYADRPPRLLIVIDEIVELLEKDTSKTEEAKEESALKDEAHLRIGKILQLGRAAGIHLLLAGQRVPRTLLSGTAQNNISFKLLCGRAGDIERGMIGLTSLIATPGILGRAIAGSFRYPDIELQVEYVDLQKDLDRWLPMGGVDLLPPDDVDIQPVDLIPLEPIKVVRARPVVKPVGTTSVLDRDGVARPEVTSPTVTFADVGGYDDAKVLLRDAVGTLINDPGAAAQYGLTPSGVLLYGPPGTGKTLLAEATAGELGLRFCKVTTGNLTSKWVSAGPELVIAMAETVIENAPCLLFIDEFDGVAPRRDGDAHAEDRKVLTELLTQLDRLRLIPGVVVMAATNRIEALDPAAIRPGRMDTRIRVDLPNSAAREAILQASLSGRPLETGMDLASVAEATTGESGATLAAIVNTASLAALKEARPITTQDLLDAITTRGGNDRPTVETAGLDRLVLPPDARGRITQLVSLLKNPEQGVALGIDSLTGAVLYGPPGTGKTSLARAVAAEAQCSFYSCKGTDFMTKYRGDGSRALEQIFERARTNKPSVIFIDEIDGLARNRSDSDGGSEAVTTLLSLIDGFESNDGVFVIGATNRLETLDPALVRGGRLSHKIEIGLPDQAGREALMTLFTAKIPVDTDVDLAAIADLLEGFSPADMEAMVQRAALAAFNRATAAGVPTGTVTAVDFATALEILPAGITAGASTGPTQDDVMDILEGEIVDDVPDAPVGDVVDELDEAWCVDFTDALIAKDKATHAA